MSSASFVPSVFKLSNRVNRIMAGVALASWLWKMAEYAGREHGILKRNLGWGFYADCTIPVGLTAAAAVLVGFSAIQGRLQRLHTRTTATN